MKLITALIFSIWLCFAPASVHAKQITSVDDGSVFSYATHWRGTDRIRSSIQSTDYGGLVKDGPLVKYQTTIKNPDGTLPPPFLVTPLLKSILDSVFASMGPDGGYPTINQLVQASVVSSVSASQNANDPAKQEGTKAALTAAGQQTGDSAGGAAKDNAAGAIDFCSRFMQNFASDGGNKWNKVRDTIFLPIAILLLLPGAVLAQVKAIASAGNPVLGNINPFDGILRSIVAIFLIPATYLVISFGIDFSNSITFTISDQYTRLFGSNMYKDALCGELRAMPTNGASASAGSGPVPPWPQSPDIEAQNFGNGSPDPCGGAAAAKGLVNEAMPANVVYSRLAVYGANAASTTGWNILCAFQMAYLCYLYLVGPIVAALWVWPVKQLRDAFPSWIEGVITLCFWSMFWNTTILLMACFKDYGTTGTYIFTALNFLATSCVKYAFDFGGLVSAAGQDAAQKATQPAQSGSGSAGGGGKSGNNAAAAGKLPPGAHLLPGMTNGKQHAVDAQGHFLTFDSKSGTWVPDAGGTSGGTGSGTGSGTDGGGSAGSGGGAGSGGPNLSSSYAGTVVPVTVNHVPPPLTGSNVGTFTTPIPNSNNHLQIGSDGKGNLTGQLVDDAGKLVGGSMPLVADGKGGFKLDLPNGETLTLTPNAKNGSEDAIFTQTAGGAVIAQESLGQVGQSMLQFAGQNGDMVYVSNLQNGLEAVTVVGANGSVDTFVGKTGDAIVGMASDGARVNVSTDMNGNPISISLDHTPGTAGGLETFAITSGTDGSYGISYTGVDGKIDGYETISAPVISGNGAAMQMTTDFFDGSHNPVGSQSDTRTNSINGVPTDTIAQFDSSGKQVGQYIDNADNNQIVSGVFLADDGSASGYTQVADPSGNGQTWMQTDYASVDQSFNPQTAVSGAQVRSDGSVENYTYDHGKLSEDKVIAADGTTVISDSKYNYETNGNVDCTQTSYNADGSYTSTSSVSDANHTLLSSTVSNYDASNNVVGHTDVQQNLQGGYDVKQYDAKVDSSNLSGHLIASETTAAGPNGSVIDTTSNYSYSSDGVQTTKSVDTAVYQNGQETSDNNQFFVMQGGNWVEQENSQSSAGQTISFAGGTNDSVTMAGNSGNGAPEFHITAGGQSETVILSLDGHPQAYHLDNSGRPVYDTTTYDWTNNTVSVSSGSENFSIRGDAENGYNATVTGSTINGQTQSPEVFTFSAHNSGSVTSGNGSPGTPNNYSNTVKQPAPQGLMPGLATKFIPAGMVSRTAPIANAAGNNGGSGGNSGSGGKSGNGSGGDDDTDSTGGTGVGSNGQPLDIFKDATAEASEVFALDDFNGGSLQDQMISAGTHVRNTSTINSILRKSFGGGSRSESVVAATVDQNMATIYCGQGKYGQADQLYQNALKTMEKYQDAPEYSILIETYANFLDRQGRNSEADAYRARLSNSGVSAVLSW